MVKSILVTGANGQVGRELLSIHNDYPEFNFLFADRKQLDITDEDSVKKYFIANKIDILINCAAYTAVDKAESDKENAQQINCDAVKYLAEACKAQNTLFIHISTDFVFNGNKTTPYKEDDIPNPTGVYAATKLCGEAEALKYARSMVVRTSWVYSSFGNNFVKTMLRLGKEKPELKVVNDQTGSPTYARDLAHTLLFMAKNYSEKNLHQIYHYSNLGTITWYGFARTIFELKKINIPVHPISTSDFPTPVKRPSYSVLDKTKILHDFQGIKINNWKESLADCLALIK